jgi:tetratricopeptide (TPR) repeat protein
MTHTASADWSGPLHPDGTLAQADDESDPSSLEERARAIFGNAPMHDTPPYQLNQEPLFGSPVGSPPARELPLAAQGYMEMAKSSRDPRLAKRATEIAAYGRLQSQSLEAARLWLELDKNNPQARQTLAALLVSSNKLSEAKPLLEAMITADGNVAAGFMQLHSMLSKHPDRNAVLSITKELAKCYPQLPEAHFAVAQAAFSAGKYDVATTEIKEALKLSRLGRSGRCSTPSCCSNASQYQGDRAGGGSQAYPKAREVRELCPPPHQQQTAQAARRVSGAADDQPNNADIAVTIGLLFCR